MWADSITPNYEMTGRRRSYEELDLVVDVLGKVDINEIAREVGITVFDGDAYMVDYPKTLKGLSSGRVAVRLTSYYSILACHPGISRTLEQEIDEVLNKAADQGYAVPRSLSELREHVYAYTDDSNVLHRPAPAGVSVVLTAREDGDLFTLISRRSNRVALNPGVWTTAVDEGLNNPRPGVSRKLAWEGLNDEVGFTLEERRSGSLRACGFFLPERSPDESLAVSPARSGANEIWELELQQRDRLEEVASRLRSNINSDSGIFEVDQVEVMSCDSMRQFFSDGSTTPSEVLSAWHGAQSQGRPEP